MRSVVLVACLALVVCGASAYTGLGDRLLRTFLIFSNIPLNASESNWYQVTGECVPSLGVQYAVKQGGPTKSDPVSVYYSASGAISAFGGSVWSAPPDAQAAYWQAAGDHYDIVIGTRSSGDPCDPGTTWVEELGDSLTVSPTGQPFSIPFSSDQAESANWTPGACIGKMGRHYGYDLATAPVLSGSSANLFPFMPMYNVADGNVAAVLLQTSGSVDVEPFGDFEAFFPSSLFCLNFCGNCSMDTTLATMHFLFNDPSLSQCPNGRCN
jgi:WAS/WASL-interacting protein